MAWVATAVVGGSVIGALSSRNAANTQAGAANNAAQMQTDAANRSAQLQYDATTRGQDQQRDMFNQAAGYSQPYRDAGASAVGQAGNYGAVPGYNAYASTGAGAMPQWRSMTNADLNANLAPNYAFQLAQGQGALANQMNATGGLVSGNAQQALQQFSQDYAGNAYQRAFENFNANQINAGSRYQQGFGNYQTEQQQALARNQTGYDRLMGLAGLGQNAAAGTGSQAIQTGQSIATLGQQGAQGMGNAYTTGASGAGNYLTQGANAQASGQIGTANAINNGVNSYLGWNYLNSRPGGEAPAVRQT